MRRWQDGLSADDAANADRAEEMFNSYARNRFWRIKLPVIVAVAAWLVFFAALTYRFLR